MKKISQFYETPYKLFKILPKVRLILFAIIFFVLGVMDSSRERYGEFGIFKSDSSSEEFMIWLVVGALVCGYIYIMTTIEIAPVIIQTDALLALNEKTVLDTKSTNGKNVDDKLERTEDSERIKKLNDLRKQGYITEEEYQKAIK